MFSRADKTKAPAVATRAAPSLISTDLEMTGNIKTSGEVQLDGTMQGDIICGKLIVGEKAIIIGQIEAQEVIIKGRITGRVRAGSVLLAKTARVIGDIWHDTLTVEGGALLEGHCQRNESTPASTAAPLTQVPTAPVGAAPAAISKAKAAPAQHPDLAATGQGPAQDGAGNTFVKTAAGN
ncbi:MAG: polymer-forming cytoskeletal protein [Proteobacteria bacterium]|nr:polymer-forming cytoskeletal protein [Pseudomonadota bacterium]